MLASSIWGCGAQPVSVIQAVCAEALDDDYYFTPEMLLEGRRGTGYRALLRVGAGDTDALLAETCTILLGLAGVPVPSEFQR